MGPGEVLGVFHLLITALRLPLYHLLSTHGGAVYDQKHRYPPQQVAAGADTRMLFIYEHYQPGIWHGMAWMMDGLDTLHSVLVGGYPLTHMGVR